jgi:hypothetical protein
MCLGDGHETATSLSYSTSSRQLRDDIQIIVQHAGYTSGFFKHVEEGSTRVDSSGRVYKANADNWHVQIRRKRLYPTLNHGHSTKQGGQSEEIIQYSGKVYCISVPSEVFYIRRNGKPIWTGNSRGSNGPIVMLTRQCSEGRARNGGLRLGEMERDCFIGHGSSTFLKEKMLDSADNYRVFICKNCGMIANVNPDKNIYKCNNCKNISDIVQIRIPYAFKLLSQELYTMNVLMRFVCN